jgi:hypothetical protein
MGSYSLCMLGGSAAHAQANAKNVLILHNWGESPSELDRHGINRAGPCSGADQLLYRIGGKPAIRPGSLSGEPGRDSPPWVRRRNAGRVVAATYPVLEFAVKYRDTLFPGVPIVFTDISRREMQTWPGVTGVISTLGMREMIDLALRLQPDTNEVAVISGLSVWDRYWFEAAHSELLHRQDKMKEIDIIGAPSAEMLEKVTALPAHTVVLFQMRPDDLALPAIGPFDVLDAAVRRLPTYSAWPGLSLEHGGVGGAYRDVFKDAALNGEIVARVLPGEQPANIPIVYDSDLQVRVNWRALQQWHIPESALPAGSVILYRPPSFWDSYRRYVIAVIVTIGLLLLLIGLGSRARMNQ